MEIYHHDQEETLQEQKETRNPPLNLETELNEQHISILDGIQTPKQLYAVSLRG